MVPTVRTAVTVLTGVTAHTDRGEFMMLDSSSAVEEVVEAQAVKLELSDPSITERIRERDERIHINLGAFCNNNCVFCMEEDREERYVTNSAMTQDRVRWVLESHREAQEVCFTSGEPTLNENLPQYVGWGKALGFRHISVMTNGRRLGYLPYTVALVKAGMNRFYVSIHGHTQKLHEGLTRTPKSFDQTVAGLDAVSKVKRFGVELHTSTVLTKRNLPHLLEIYKFLRSHGVDQVVFNVMQANGRADTYFEQIFPSYTEIASQFRSFVSLVGEAQPMAFLVDIPLCTTEGIPDFNRGYVEKYFHYDPMATTQMPAAQDQDRKRGKGLVVINRSDMDTELRSKRDECLSCSYNPVCEGVWNNYLKRKGWDEFQPVLAHQLLKLLGFFAV
jgi:MoaA/NifB/PqqE/SkfB family radical SAM enzyme